MADASRPIPAPIDALVHARHGDPFAVLGPHEVDGGCAIRAFLPGADSVAVLDARHGRALGALARIHPDGCSGAARSRAARRIGCASRCAGDDGARPRIPTVPAAARRSRPASARRGPASRSRPWRSARIRWSIDGVRGVRFAVWAPNAQRVSVVGDFNGWDGRRHPMRLRHGAGRVGAVRPAARRRARSTNTRSLGPRRRACCR